MSKSINLQNQLKVNTASPRSGQESESNVESQQPEDIVIEELSVELNKQFIKTKLKKYFKDLYKDLSTIKSVPTSSGAALLDKNAFIEFINCPGIVSDRLFTLASQGNKEERIEQSNFVKLMLEIYSSDIDGKMNLVFKVFDFDGDGKITAEDVRIILSYIPRSREQCTSSL
jgi:Ca2+-binding EF-hand superfamily protein